MKSQIPSSPIQLSTPVKFRSTLPGSADCVVVGGGVIGIFSALYMARSGLKVVVCEKGRIAAEQSSRNWGWIRQHGRDPAELPIMMEALQLWEDASKETNNRTGFVRGGVCYLASSEKELERQAKWLEVAEQCRLDTRVLSRAELDRIIKRSDADAKAHPWTGATYTKSDARAEPWQAVPAIAELARSQGVVIRENCAVRALDTANGDISAVATEDGLVKTSQVILAAGAWSSLFARRHGICIPQLSVRSTVLQTGKLPKFINGNAADEDFAFRRRVDGGYTLAGGGRHDHYIGPDSFRNFFSYLPVLRDNMADTSLWPMAPAGFPDSWGVSRNWAEDAVSPFEKMRVLNPAPKRSQVAAIISNFTARFPSAGEPEILNAWAGMIDAMPDVVPVVDRVPSLPGLIMATGMSGHGFGIGPGFGRIIADMVRGKPAGHDMTRFRFSRFTDGSKLAPGPGL